MGNRAARMISSAPSYYEYAKLYTKVQEAIADDLDNAEANDADLQLQLYIPTATWGLKYWEALLNLPTIVADSYTVRRSRVLGMWRGVGNFSAKMLEAVAQAFTPYPVHVRILVRERIVLVVFDEDLPEAMEDFKKLAFRIIHAHLGLMFRVRIFRKSVINWTNKCATVIKQSIQVNPWNKNDIPLRFNGGATFDGTYFFTSDYDDFGPTMKFSLTTKLADARELTPANVTMTQVRVSTSGDLPVNQDTATRLKLSGVVHNWADFDGEQNFDGTLSFDNDLINHSLVVRVVNNVVKIADTVHNWEDFDGEHNFDGALNFDNDLINHAGTLRLLRNDVTEVYQV